MKKTDMELQAIREKLHRLESEAPNTGDVLNRPWSSPQKAQEKTQRTASISSAAQLVRQTEKTSGNLSKNTPQAAAMATLRQRSIQQPHAQRHAPTHYSTEDAAYIDTDETVSSRANELVMQEIERLEIHARNINERSQQQAHEILSMKRSAQQAAVALRRQGIHQHPQLATITQFLEQYPSAMLPHFDRDTQGRFALSHTTVDLNYAEQEALHTAQTLRTLTGQRSEGSSPSADQAAKGESSLQPFSTPIEDGPSMDEYLERTSQLHPKTNRRHRAGRSASKQSSSGLPAGLIGIVNRLNSRRQKLFRQPILAGSVSAASIAPTSPSENESASERPTSPRRKRFSLLDGAIWFSAAAIIRIVLEEIVVSYPVTRMPLMLILFTAISFSIYRVFVSKSSDSTPAFRLGIVLLGLFLGSSF